MDEFVQEVIVLDDQEYSDMFGEAVIENKLRQVSLQDHDYVAASVDITSVMVQPGTKDVQVRNFTF